MRQWWVTEYDPSAAEGHPNQACMISRDHVASQTPTWNLRPRLTGTEMLRLPKKRSTKRSMLHLDENTIDRKVTHRPPNSTPHSLIRRIPCQRRQLLARPSHPPHHRRSCQSPFEGLIAQQAQKVLTRVDRTHLHQEGRHITMEAFLVPALLTPEPKRQHLVQRRQRTRLPENDDLLIQAFLHQAVAEYLLMFPSRHRRNLLRNEAHDLASLSPWHPLPAHE